jgi:hypothetical protein
MQRPVCALLLLLAVSGTVIAACGTVEDESLVCTKEDDPSCGRHLDLDYVTAAIFAPSCGQAQCHSSFHQAGGRAFDTPKAVRETLLRPDKPLLHFDRDQYDPLLELREEGEVSDLVKWVLPLNDVNDEVGRMPFDSPLPTRDIELLKIWIRAPVVLTDGTRRAGGKAEGAQCNPANYGGLACDDRDIVMCRPDFMFGEPVESCTKGCLINTLCDKPDPDEPKRCLSVPRYAAECM